MLKDVTLGQFFPGNSLLHRADPRAKLILAVLYIVFLFVAGNAVSFSLMLFSSLVLIAVSGISLRIIIKGLKPVIFILIFTFIINALFSI